jgi:hypothetical protein
MSMLLNATNNKNNKFKIKSLQKRKDKDSKRSQKMLKAKIKYLNKNKYHSRWCLTLISIANQN